MNDAMETVRGGRLVTVTRDGTTESVLVRQLPVKLYPDYLKAIDDEAAQAAMFCDKQAEWVAGLSIESHEEIIRVGEEVNNAAFFRWCARRTERRNGMTAAVGNVKALPNGSPKLPSQVG